jgi:hypothetical protein
MPSSTPRAFISHSSRDRAFVESFAASLRANGVDAWYSAWEIKPGDSIRAKIDEGLAGCEFFIIVLSRDSVNRPWVKTELDAATVRVISGSVRKIIPVRIEDCGEIPPILGSLLWEDFTSQPYESALNRVIRSIYGIDDRPPLGKPSGTGVPPASAPRPLRFPLWPDDLKEFAEQLRREGFDARVEIIFCQGR